MVTERDCAGWSAQNGWPAPLCRGYARAHGRLPYPASGDPYAMWDQWGDATGHRNNPNPSDPRIVGRFAAWSWFAEDEVALGQEGTVGVPAPGAGGAPAQPGSRYSEATLRRLWDLLLADPAMHPSKQPKAPDYVLAIVATGVMPEADAWLLAAKLEEWVDRRGYVMTADQFVGVASDVFRTAAPAPAPPGDGAAPPPAGGGLLSNPLVIAGAAVVAVLALSGRK